jgi:Uma2 family endonuclease
VNAALQANFITVEDYLQGEPESEVRHEYIGGCVHAMAGGSDAHNRIAGNLFASLHPHFRSGPCRLFFADVKARLQVAQEDIFYYPDIMVVCDPRDTNAYYKRFPKLIIEALAPNTERIDRSEKFLNYIQIDSLEEYALISQDAVEVTVFRRADHWKPQIMRSTSEVVRFESCGIEVAVADIYHGNQG